MREIDAAIPEQWTERLDLPEQPGDPQLGGWWGFFDMDLEHPLARPCIVKFRHFIFTIGASLMLTFQPASMTFYSITWTRIRVVGIKGKKRCIDPLVTTGDLWSWHLWIWEGCPLVRLQWDPGEWLWPTTEADEEPVEFFQYTVRIGKLLHLRQQYSMPTRMRAWLYGGLSHAFLSSFWSCIWSLRVSRRVSYFMWMLAHAGLAVGTWTAQMGHDPSCLCCNQGVVESTRHCLWICPHVHMVWRAVCLLLSRVLTFEGYVTWGFVSWLLQFPGTHLIFEGESADPVFMLSGVTYPLGTLDMLPTSIHQCEPLRREAIFSTVASITLWCIWKARC